MTNVDLLPPDSWNTMTKPIPKYNGKWYFVWLGGSNNDDIHHHSMVLTVAGNGDMYSWRRGFMWRFKRDGAPVAEACVCLGENNILLMSAPWSITSQKNRQ